MAFKMKGSAFKLNNVATKSALKQGKSPMKLQEKLIDGVPVSKEQYMDFVAKQKELERKMKYEGQHGSEDEYDATRSQLEDHLGGSIDLGGSAATDDINLGQTGSPRVQLTDDDLYKYIRTVLQKEFDPQVKRGDKFARESEDFLKKRGLTQEQIDAFNRSGY